MYFGVLLLQIIRLLQPSTIASYSPCLAAVVADELSTADDVRLGVLLLEANKRKSVRYGNLTAGYFSTLIL